MSGGRALFVSGTDTDVGKTVAAAWLAAELASGGRVALVKPAQTGTTTPAADGDEAFYRAALAGREVTIRTLVSLAEPLAPSIAADRARAPIDVEALVAECRAIASRNDITLFEGAGGLLVTLTDDVDMAELARRLDAPVVLVVRPSLGTLNHTLLSVEAARNRGLSVQLIVVSGYPDDAGVVERENLRFLRNHLPEIPLAVLRRADLSGAEPLAGLAPRFLGEPPAFLRAARERAYVEASDA